MVEDGVGAIGAIGGELLERFETLRPNRLVDFTGQASATGQLGIILSSALSRREMPDHMLLSGPPGCGKTTLAAIIANELGLPMLTTSGPAIGRASDLAALLASIGEPSVIFIDEIHALPRSAVELLYPVMEDGVLDIVTPRDGVSGEVGSVNVIRLPLPALIIVGATTIAGSLPAPLLDRFGHQVRVHLYDDLALAGIVSHSAKLMGVALDSAGGAMIASRSRGTPRVANALLRRVRDFAQASALVATGAHEYEEIGANEASRALDAFGVDKLGLDVVALSVLRALCNSFSGGPVGLTTLASAVGEAPITIESVYEPYLMRAGLISRTPRGRVATAACYEHLGIVAPVNVVGMVDGTELLF